MPLSRDVVPALLAQWAEEITYASLHTSAPGRTGENEWETIDFDVVRVVGGARLVGTVNEFDRFPQRFSSTVIVVTHLAFRRNNGSVFGWRSIGNIRLGNRDGIVVPAVLTILTITERG